MSHSRTLGISLLITISFGFVELFTGLYTNSLALMSDSGHMFTDSAALLIAFIGSYLASKGPTPRMTYGLKRVEVLSSFINAIFLIILVGYIVYQSLSRFFKPVHVLAVPMLSVAFLGFIINLVMVVIFHRHAQENINIKVAFLHVILDTIGSISTLVAGLLVLFTNAYIVDTIVSLALSLLIVPQVYGILKMTLEIFLQAAPAEVSIQNLKSKLSELPNVKEVHALHLWSLTSKDYVFTTHVVVDSLENYSKTINDIYSILQQYGIRHITVQIEDSSTYCPLRENAPFQT